MAMNWFNQALRCICLLYFMFLTACTDGIPLTPANNRGWIEVTQPTSESVYTTTADSVLLSGDAFILPTDNPEKLDITWQNAANNTQGTGVSNVGCIDLVTAKGCFSGWSIASGQISLELGNNLITITAADDKGNRGTVSINVIRSAAVALNLSPGKPQAQFNPMSLMDVNGDGELDVIALNLDHDGPTSENEINAEDLVVVFLAEAENGFRQSYIMNTVSDPQKLAVCDINADDLVDMIVHNAASEISIFTGNGDGTFDRSAVIHGADTSKLCPVSGAVQVENLAADLNHDHHIDAISVDSESKTLKVSMGDEHLPSTTVLDQAAKFIISADISNDGVPDIITVNSGSVIGSISVLMGLGDGSFDTELVYKFEK